jgi:hypothetical protein
VPVLRIDVHVTEVGVQVAVGAALRFDALDRASA